MKRFEQPHIHDQIQLLISELETITASPSTGLKSWQKRRALRLSTSGERFARKPDWTNARLGKAFRRCRQTCRTPPAAAANCLKRHSVSLKKCRGHGGGIRYRSA